MKPKDKPQVADAQLRAVISAEDRASKVIAGVGSALEGTKSKLQSFIPTFKTVAVTGAAVGGALVLVGKKAISAAADYEQSQISFTTMLGSAEKANQLLKDLVDFGKKTPFELPGLIEASKKLIAFGTAQKDVLPVLKQLGDIAAGVGIPVNQLAELYGKAQVQGRLFAEDVNQLTGRGIPIIQEFAKQFGVSEGEVRKLVESGKIGFPQLQKAFESLTNEGSKFGGLMDAQSASFSGMFSNFKDGISEMMRQLGERLLPYAKQVLEELNKFIGEIPGAIENLIKVTQEKIEEGKQIWEGLKIKVKEFKNEVLEMEVVKNILNTLKTAFDSIWTAVKDNLYPALKDLWSTVKNDLYPAFVQLWDALKPLEPYFKLMASVVGAVLVIALILLVKIITEVVIGVAKVLEIWARFETWIIKNGVPVIKVFTTEVGKVVNAFMDVVNWVDKAIGKVGAFAEKVSRINLNPFSSNFSIPGLFGRASGGAISPNRSFLVGERGPELFTPSTYGQITRNSHLGGGGGITVNVYGDVSGRELIDKVKRGIMSELKSNVLV